MRRVFIGVTIALVIGIIGGALLVVVVLPQPNMQIVRDDPQGPPGPPGGEQPVVYEPPGNPAPPESLGQPGSGPDWEFAATLLDPHGGFNERTVNYLGNRAANSLSGYMSRTSDSNFFWALAELPASYAQRKPVRLEGTFALDDTSEPNSAYKFELRLNNGSPQVYDVRPNVPAAVDVSMVGIYRVDVRALGVGGGMGQPIFVEPKFYFR